MLKEVFSRVNFRDNIGEPPWEYDFLYNLPESEYPKYLKKIFKYRTGQNVDLTPVNSEKRRGGVFLRSLFKKKTDLNTFNQKMQWLKLYDASTLKINCTDKVRVRDYVKAKIGEAYLKPVLQIIPGKNNCSDNLVIGNNSEIGCVDKRNYDTGTYFEQIDFDSLPEAFVIKCNHGSKWQYIIKDKEEFLQNKRLFDIVKRNVTGWLEQEYWCWNGFEMQYKGIEPKILIEPLMKEDVNKFSQEIYFFCFHGEPKYAIKMYNPKQVSTYDENLKITEDVFDTDEKNLPAEADELLKYTYSLSKRLSKDFKFVRVDWIIYQKKPYFCELTFTPFSGFRKFKKEEYDLKFGNWIEL